MDTRSDRRKKRNAKMIQLEMFPEDMETRIKRKIIDIDEKCEKNRKSQHARITGLQKQIKQLELDLAFLTSKICKEGLFL